MVKVSRQNLFIFVMARKRLMDNLAFIGAGLIGLSCVDARFSSSTNTPPGQ
jgi:hypothetical protein